jgi:capsular polysaccharide biosynthesis protein
MYIQLYIDNGMGFVAQDAIKLMVAPHADLQEFVFNLPKQARALRLVPLAECTTVEIVYLTLIRETDELDLMARLAPNATALVTSTPPTYYFNTADTQIHINPLGALDLATAQQLQVGIRYLSAGKRVFDTRIFPTLLQQYATANTHQGNDMLVGEVVSVQHWCEATQSPYYVIGSAQQIVTPSPKYIGAKIDATFGVANTNELYVAELKQARIISKCDVIIVDNTTVLCDAMTHTLGGTIDPLYEPAIKYQHANKLLVDYTNYQKIHAERGILLAGVTSHHFGHWMLEHLPKYRMLDALRVYDNWPVYVDADMPASHYDSLRLITGGKRQIIKIAANTTVIFDRLLIAPTFTFFPYHCWPETQMTIDIGPISPGSCHYLRAKLLSAMGLDAMPIVTQKKGRRLFIARDFISARKMLNEAEIQDFLKTLGFEMVYPEQLTFEQQVRIFNEAEIIIGPNGSGFTNAFFCKEGTKIIMLGRVYTDNFASWIHALEKLGLQHLFVAGPSVATDTIVHHQNYIVPLVLIRQALAYFDIDGCDR